MAQQTLTMTPKEKAMSLVKKMSISDSIQLNRNQYGIKCALIAVDEILSELAYTQNYVEDTMNKIQVYISYWQEVKQEIVKL